MKRLYKKINTREDFVLDNISDRNVHFILENTRSKLDWFTSMKNHPGLLQIDKKNGLLRLTSFGSQPSNIMSPQNVLTHELPKPVVSLKNPTKNLMQPGLTIEITLEDVNHSCKNDYVIGLKCLLTDDEKLAKPTPKLLQAWKLVEQNEHFFETQLYAVNPRRLETNLQKSINDVHLINEISFMLKQLLSDKYPNKAALQMKIHFYEFIKKSNKSIITQEDIKKFVLELYNTTDYTNKSLEPSYNLITFHNFLKKLIEKV